MEFLLQVIKDTGKGIKGYIKSQLILMIITFIILSISLTIIDVTHPILISLGISILDILPIVGSGIVMVPWAIISFGRQDSAGPADEQGPDDPHRSDPRQPLDRRSSSSHRRRTDRPIFCDHPYRLFGSRARDVQGVPRQTG